MQELPAGLLDDVVRRLVDTIQPRAIYLFGSHAPSHAGRPHKHSDLDLLIVVDDDGDLHELFARATAAMRDIVVPMDLVIWHRREVEKWQPVRFSLPYEATHKGVRLYAA
jgi:predicted nucleotidyltransferase